MDRDSYDLARTNGDIWHLWVMCFPTREEPAATKGMTKHQVMLEQIATYIRELHNRRP